MPRRDVTKDKDDGEGETRDDVELEGAESLLSRLRRQYRIMERNRRQYRDEAMVVLSRQRKMLADLQREHGELSVELKACLNSQNEQKDSQMKTELTSILDQHVFRQHEVDEEREKLQEIEKVIAETEKKLRDVRRRVPSAKRLRATRLGAQATNKALENRISQAMVHLNAVLAKNRVLREDIQSHLKERDKFLLQVQRTEKQLNFSTKRKSDVMDLVAKAYAERDEAQFKMRALIERSDRDSVHYSHELRKLQRALDHHHTLRNFVATVTAGEEDDASRRKQEEAEGDRDGPEQTLATYQASLAHLQEISSGNSVEAIVSNYLQAENDNYTLFSYISNLNNEVTSLTTETRQLQGTVESLREEGAKKRRTAEETVKSLQEELAAAADSYDELEGEVKRSDDTLEDMKTFTEEMFSMLECDQQPLQDIVGAGGGLSSANMTVYLSVIEQRIHELLQLRQFLRGEDIPPQPPPSAPPVEDQLTLEACKDEASATQVPASSSNQVIFLSRTQLHHPASGTHNAPEEELGGPMTHIDLLANLRLHIPPTMDT
ncbi:coiled-coil domain containing protein 114 [Oratosquilla oratoria]|uniref:coiled-coil domain containing protein 114 n=1 Tax=Oratosquilla oratoria TaxID=337810 RepID=UPI003F75779E